MSVTNGWRQTCPFIQRLWSTDDVEWFSVRNREWIDAYVDALDPADRRRARHDGEFDPEHLYTAVEVSDAGDSAIYLLDAQSVDSDGEWAAWLLADWLPRAITYPSFQQLMQAERERYLSLRP